MRLKNILTIGLLVALFSSCAIQKKIKTADKLYKNNSYYNAVDLYGEAFEKKENNTKLTYKIAETNRQLKDYVQAESFYAKTEEMNAKAWPEAKFYKALMMKNQGKYDEASTELQAFVDAGYTGDVAGLVSRAKMEIKGCELAKEMKDAKSEAEVDTVDVGLNNTLQDLSPKVIGKDKVLMAALLSENAIELESARDANDDYFTKLYFATNEGGTWKREMLSDNINSANEHVGNGVVSRDGNTMYFTRCSEIPSQVMTCNIYKSNKVNGEWAEADALTAINRKDASTTQPALAYDEVGNELMYFASNRQGSKGGMDIYYAAINEEGEFSAPKNLGSKVNTKYDDITPHYDGANNKLYFSSEGHPGFGGLDVFSIEGFGEEMEGEVVNAGFPINSSADDLYLALNNEGTDGYMVSNRVGTTSTRGETCCDDVFKVSLVRDLFMSCNFALEGDDSNTPIEGVEASIYKVNNGDFDFVGEGTTTNTNLVFSIDKDFSYKVNGNKDGFWPSISTVEAEEITSMDGDTLFKTFYLKALDRIKVKNVYFAFDKSAIRTMYGQEMDSVLSLMNKFGDLVLQIDGHTDNKGSDVYNEKLSKRRATEAKEYFLEKGITTERINTAGYGETNPIAPNENTDGSDNKAGRAKNRRVEFKLSNMEKGIKVDYEAQEPTSVE
tara:strand:+ start:98 stop:2104 length:2007 start_codon:yes stop_codon:yes gene_type:complete